MRPLLLSDFCLSPVTFDFDDAFVALIISEHRSWPLSSGDNPARSFVRCELDSWLFPSIFTRSWWQSKWWTTGAISWWREQSRRWEWKSSGWRRQPIGIIVGHQYECRWQVRERHWNGCTSEEGNELVTYYFHRCSHRWTSTDRIDRLSCT